MKTLAYAGALATLPPLNSAHLLSPAPCRVHEEVGAPHTLHLTLYTLQALLSTLSIFGKQAAAFSGMKTLAYAGALATLLPLNQGHLLGTLRAAIKAV